MLNVAGMAVQRSEDDFPSGHGTELQLALIFVTGFEDQDQTVRTALHLLRRKYTFVQHVIATVVCPLFSTQNCSLASQSLPQESKMRV